MKHKDLMESLLGEDDKSKITRVRAQRVNYSEREGMIVSRMDLTDFNIKIIEKAIGTSVEKFISPSDDGKVNFIIDLFFTMSDGRNIAVRLYDYKESHITCRLLDGYASTSSQILQKKIIFDWLKSLKLKGLDS